jgi:hypothetical protein
MAESRKFDRPISFVQGQDMYRPNEVGVTHPTMPAFIRLKDNGDVEIVACEGCSIILHPAKRSITFVADSIKFLTKGGMQGMTWNGMAFNENANTFNEPTLVPVQDDDAYSPYKGVEQFIYQAGNTDQDDAPVVSGLPLQLARTVNGSTTVGQFPQAAVTDPETGSTITWQQYYEKYGKPPPFGQTIVNQ